MAEEGVTGGSIVDLLREGVSIIITVGGIGLVLLIAWYIAGQFQKAGVSVTSYFTPIINYWGNFVTFAIVAVIIVVAVLIISLLRTKMGISGK